MVLSSHPHPPAFAHHPPTLFVVGWLHEERGKFFLNLPADLNWSEYYPLRTGLFSSIFFPYFSSIFFSLPEGGFCGLFSFVGQIYSAGYLLHARVLAIPRR